MLILQNIFYTHPNKDLLFSDLSLIVNKRDKIALTGHNGTGKSTLLNILAGNSHSSAGYVKSESQPYHVPQLASQLNHCTVAEALGIQHKFTALKKILGGEVTEENMAALDDDWTIEERCEEAFVHWKLHGLDPDSKMRTLSGGQKTRVLLAGIMIHRPEIILLDEPSNHLDDIGRKILYDYIQTTSDTLVVVSHDRSLLNLVNSIYELGKNGITIYGGNYEFYAEQKILEMNVLDQKVKSGEKTLRKARETEREVLQRQQKLDARGKKKQEKSGLPTISMNTLKNNAENSTSRMKVSMLKKRVTFRRN